MDGTNHSSQTLQSLSPDKREDLEHELRPEALASIAREENAEASTNTTHAAVSPKPRAETAWGVAVRGGIVIVLVLLPRARVADRGKLRSHGRPVSSVERKLGEPTAVAGAADS